MKHENFKHMKTLYIVNNCLQKLAFYFILLTFISCNTFSDNELSFVVIGDVHYEMPDYKTAGYLVPQIAGELDTLKIKPDFIIQTGDFFHAGRGSDIKEEVSFAFNNFAENFKIPFFISKGNHDSREYYEKVALPRFSSELKKEVTTSWFSFDKANCHFIILDCTEENFSDQLIWLEKDLKTASENPGTEHIFVFGHYPLWIIARAGFTRNDFVDPVALLLKRYKVDAYFCGHTHNKSVTVRLTGDQPLTQIMDAAVVEEGRLFGLAPYLNHVAEKPENPFQPGILPLDNAHQIFIPKSELLYYRGYQEGSTTSYNVITVKGKNVQVDWHTAGKGTIISYTWNEPGKITDLKTPDKKEEQYPENCDLGEIERAWLYTAIWTDEDSVRATILINGTDAGDLLLDKATMAYSPFWNKVEVDIKKPATCSLSTENILTMTNPDKKRFGIAHTFLLAELKDGRFVKSNISPVILTSFKEHAKLVNFPPADLVESVDPGLPLVKVVLKFNEIIEKQMHL